MAQFFRKYQSNAVPITIGSLLASMVGFVVAVFGSNWNEEINHATYSYLSNTSRDGMSGKLGIVTHLGVPVYDFGTALGLRMPLQHAGETTPFVLLRFWMTESQISLLILIVLLAAIFASLGAMCERQSINALLLCTAASVSILPLIWRYVLNLDTFSYAYGYIGVALLVSAIVADYSCVRYNSYVAKWQRLRILSGFFALSVSHLNYSVTAAIVIVSFLVLDGLRRLAHGQRLRIPMRTVGLGVIIYLLSMAPFVLDVAKETLIQEKWTRDTFAPALQLFSEFSMNSLKHTIKQIVAFDYWGILRILVPSFAIKYGQVTIPPQASFWSAVILVVVVLGRSIRHHHDKSWFGGNQPGIRLVAALVWLYAWWVVVSLLRLDQKPWGPSDVNAVAHPAHLFAVFVIYNFSFKESGLHTHTIPRNTMVSTIAVVLLSVSASNGILSLYAELQSRQEDDQLLRSSSSVWQEPARRRSTVSWFSDHQIVGGGHRFLTISQGFDARKYFTSPLAGFESYSDLRDHGLLAVNGYTKIRSVPELITGRKLSSHTGPDYIPLAWQLSCATDELSFLGIKYLAASSDVARKCERIWMKNNGAQVLARVQSRTGSEVSGQVNIYRLDDATAFYLASDALPVSCAVLEQSCIGDLATKTDQSIEVRALESGVLQVFLRPSRNVDIGYKPQKLILPIKFDPRLVARLEGKSVAISEYSNFAVLNIPEAQQRRHLAVTVGFSPDYWQVLRSISVWMQLCLGASWVVIVGLRSRGYRITGGKMLNVAQHR